MAIALGRGLVSVATYFASGMAFEMLSLSGQYYAATTDAQRTVLLAAGQTTTAVWQGTAFDVSYILAAIAFLIIGLVMWRSSVFGKVTASAGIVMGAMSFLPPTAGTIGMIFALGSLGPLEIWAVLVGRRSFGKALVQVPFLVQPAADEVMLTIAYVETPSGRIIQRRYRGLSVAQYETFAGKGGAPTDTEAVYKTDRGRFVRGQVRGQDVDLLAKQL